MPNNFSTSHVYIHHRLNGGMGDTFYQWDLDRSSWNDLMLFLHRILMHTIGVSSLRYFKEAGLVRARCSTSELTLPPSPCVQTRQYSQLLRGCYVYWLVVPSILMYLTKSWSFLFLIYFQPFFGMTYFLVSLCVPVCVCPPPAPERIATARPASLRPS